MYIVLYFFQGHAIYFSSYFLIYGGLEVRVLARVFGVWVSSGWGLGPMVWGHLGSLGIINIKE